MTKTSKYVKGYSSTQSEFSFYPFSQDTIKEPPSYVLVRNEIANYKITKLIEESKILEAEVKEHKIYNNTTSMKFAETFLSVWSQALWLSEQLEVLIKRVNKLYYNYPLRGISEFYNIIRYDTNCYNSWHHDSIHTKLTATIALNSPDEYDGGEFVVLSSGEELKPNKGDVIIMDGRLAHGVNAVTRGSRLVCVAWIV